MKRRIVGKGIVCTLLLVAATAAVHSQTAAVSSDPVMRAMVDELQRSINELQFKDLDKPYFVQYVILDQERYRASATFGALTSSDTSRGRIVQAQVRVGNYDFDNSEFMTGPAFRLQAICRTVGAQTRFRSEQDSRRTDSGLLKRNCGYCHRHHARIGYRQDALGKASSGMV